MAKRKPVVASTETPQRTSFVTARSEEPKAPSGTPFPTVAVGAGVALRVSSHPLAASQPGQLARRPEAGRYTEPRRPSPRERC